VRKRSSRVAVASPPLLGAAARIHAGRSQGRRRVRQRNSRVAVLFLRFFFSILTWNEKFFFFQIRRFGRDIDIFVNFAKR
jgi:hypothetical protein